MHPPGSGRALCSVLLPTELLSFSGTTDAITAAKLCMVLEYVLKIEDSELSEFGMGKGHIRRFHDGIRAYRKFAVAVDVAGIVAE
eukprot:gene11854-biopygen8767